MRKPTFMEPMWKAGIQNPVSLGIMVLGSSVSLIRQEWLEVGLWVVAICWVLAQSVTEFRLKMQRDYIQILEDALGLSQPSVRKKEGGQ